MIETEDVVARLAAHANSRINNPNEPARQYLLGLVAELRAALSATPIERLREENARYREAHEKIIELKLAGDSISRAALNQQ